LPELASLEPMMGSGKIAHTIDGTLTVTFAEYRTAPDTAKARVEAA
jgi:hypothetical protein